MEIKILVVGELSTNCYILFSNKEALVIDPGGEPEKILKEIEDKKCSLEYIVNTHGHLDHTLGNKTIEKKTKAKILKGLKEGDKIKLGEIRLDVIETPGHTEDSICLVGENFIFTGDTLFENGYGRTDLEGGSEEKLIASLKKISKIITKDMTIYPGHGNHFKIE